MAEEAYGVLSGDGVKSGTKRMLECLDRAGCDATQVAAPSEADVVGATAAQDRGRGWRQRLSRTAVVPTFSGHH